MRVTVAGEPAMPRPLAESGTIRRLGAEVLEFRVRDEDAVCGMRIRELGLPRDALQLLYHRNAERLLHLQPAVRVEIVLVPERTVEGDHRPAHAGWTSALYTASRWTWS